MKIPRRPFLYLAAGVLADRWPDLPLPPGTDTRGACPNGPEIVRSAGWPALGALIPQASIQQLWKRYERSPRA
jgi:hypothetical protein